MTSFENEKWRLQNILSDINCEEERYKRFVSSFESMDLDYRVDRPKTRDVVYNFKNRIYNIQNCLHSVLDNANNELSSLETIYDFLDKFYNVILKEIKELYKTKEFKKAIEKVNYCWDIMPRYNHKLVNEAIKVLKLTRYELKFSIFETNQDNEIVFVRTLFDDFVKDIDILKTPRCAAFAPKLIEQYLDKEIANCKNNNQILNFYFKNFVKVRTIWRVFKDSTNDIVSKHINNVTKLVDEHFQNLYEKDMDIDSLLDLQKSVKSFPFVLKPKNEILIKESKALEKKFYDDNLTRLDSEKLKRAIDFNLKNLLSEHYKGSYVFFLQDVAFELLDLIKKFEDNHEKLIIICSSVIKNYNFASYPQFVAMVGNRYGVNSPIFKVFNSPIIQKGLKTEIYLGSLLKYLYTLFENFNIKRKDFSIEQEFAYKLGQCYFNNNRAYIASKYVNDGKINNLLSFLGFKPKNDYLKHRKYELPLDNLCKTKKANLRSIQKKVYIIQTIIFVIIAIAFIVLTSLSRMDFDISITTPFKNLNRFVMPIISGSLSGLILLGRAVFILRQEGKYSIDELKIEKKIDVTCIPIFSIGCVFGIISTLYPSLVFFSTLMYEIFILSLFYVGTVVMFGFVDQNNKFKKISILKIVNCCLSLLILVFSVLSLLIN